MSHIKVLFCGYREWAIETYREISCLDRSDNLDHVEFSFCRNKEVMEHMIKEYSFDAIICAGWSWIIPDEIVENNLVVGIHPSDLPAYAGGSPLQHQIMDNVENTKCTLFRLRKELDAGEIYDKEPLNLSGDNMQLILRRLSRISSELIRRFLINYPNFDVLPNNVVETRKRLQPHESNLIDNLEKLLLSDDVSVKNIYNFIRCKTNPYPNAFIEDETGKLYFEKVKFEGKI